MRSVRGIHRKPISCRLAKHARSIGTSASESSKALPDAIQSVTVCGLHLLQHFNAEHVKALLENARRHVAEHEAIRSVILVGFKHRTGFVESREVAGEIVKVIAEKVGAIILN